MSNFKSVKTISNLFSFEKEGDTLEGVFNGIRAEQSKKGKDLIVGNITTAEGIQNDFFVGGMLKGLLEKISVGPTIQIVFEGKHEAEIIDEKGEKLKTMCNQFDVLIDS